MAEAVQERARTEMLAAVRMAKKGEEREATTTAAATTAMKGLQERMLWCHHPPLAKTATSPGAGLALLRRNRLRMLSKSGSKRSLNPVGGNLTVSVLALVHVDFVVVIFCNTEKWCRRQAFIYQTDANFTRIT